VAKPATEDFLFFPEVSCLKDSGPLPPWEATFLSPCHRQVSDSCDSPVFSPVGQLLQKGASSFVKGLGHFPLAAVKASFVLSDQLSKLKTLPWPWPFEFEKELRPHPNLQEHAAP